MKRPLKFWSLGFDPATEAEYRALKIAQMASQVRAVIAFVAVGYFAFVGFSYVSGTASLANTQWALALGILGAPFAVFFASRRMSTYRKAWALGIITAWLSGLSVLMEYTHAPVAAALVVMAVVLGSGLNTTSAMLMGLWGSAVFMAAQGGVDVWLDWAMVIGLSGLLSATTERRSRQEFLANKSASHSYKLMEMNNAKLVQLSNRDALTHVPNRRRFDKVLTEEWRRARREGYPLTVMMIDVDAFKQYNDTYGHQAGDRCLQHVALCLRAFARRQGDLLARYGGEEFAMVLPRATEEEASSLAIKMLEAVREANIEHLSSSVAPHVTVSIGVASAMPSKHDQPKALSDRADQALYLAKRSGRNQYKTATEMATIPASASEEVSVLDEVADFIS